MQMPANTTGDRTFSSQQIYSGRQMYYRLNHVEQLQKQELTDEEIPKNVSTRLRVSSQKQYQERFSLFRSKHAINPCRLLCYFVKQCLV